MSSTKLRAHAHDLAKAFDVRLVDTAIMRPEEALSIPARRLVVMSEIVDETTYAVALHEIGHLVAPLGALPHTTGLTAARSNGIVLLEEESAWAWAQHYALDWTPAMEQVKEWALSSYRRHGETRRPVPPQEPTAAPGPYQPQIDWSTWK
jgi:hypothetical protein